MNAVPVPAEIVADVGLVKENVKLPSLALHGVAGEHVAPMVRVVEEVTVPVKSVSWLAFWIAEPPPLPPLSSDHVFVAAQPYKFDPAATFVRKNISPTVQVAGSVAPDATGLVAGCPVKFAFLLCACKSICVWLQPCCKQNKMTVLRNNIRRFLSLPISI